MSTSALASTSAGAHSGPAWSYRGKLRPDASLRATRTLVVPGLLQTEDYARAMLCGEPGVTPEEIEEHVIARMEHQTILRRPEPPML
jgi:hypothetical protein